MSDVILAVILLFPVVFTYFFKSNAVLAFFALCAGYTIQSFAAHDLTNLFDKGGFNVSSDSVGSFLILLPVVLTLAICRGPSSRSLANPKVLLNWLAALATGAVAILMAVPFFDYIGGSRLTDSGIWTAIEKAQTEIISIGVLASLVFIWLGMRKGSSLSKHHK